MAQVRRRHDELRKARLDGFMAGFNAIRFGPTPYHSARLAWEQIVAECLPYKSVHL